MVNPQAFPHFNIKYGNNQYQIDISADTLSSITDKVIPAMNEWRQRPLESMYAFVYMDCMHYDGRKGGHDSRKQQVT